MLIPLSKESCHIYQCKPLTICVFASCLDVLTGSLYLGPLETCYFLIYHRILFRDHQLRYASTSYQ